MESHAGAIQKSSERVEERQSNVLGLEKRNRAEGTSFQQLPFPPIPSGLLSPYT